MPWRDWASGSRSVIAGGSGQLCLACFPPAALDTQTPRQVRGLGSSRAIAALSAHSQPSCPPPWCSTHHTAHRYCRRSHCHHHSATGSGCSSHSGRGTRPPHTPGGLRAESSQAAAGSGGHYLEAQQKASQSEQSDTSKAALRDLKQVAVPWGCFSDQERR